MQLCALDKDDALVFAQKAAKHRDYRCLECRQVVRLRRGIYRQPHYYHVQPNRICRSHGKGMPHLMQQYCLAQQLPCGEAEMECRFDAIGRIADVAWHPKRLVYEIQCSAMTAEEVSARNADYASIGYQVIWILHDSRYNQRRLSPLEDALCSSPHYFTNMDSEGNGMVYDQFAIIDRGVRRNRLPALPVDLSLPRYDKGLKNRLPHPVNKRAAQWSLGFYGDTVQRLKEGDIELHRQVKELAVYNRWSFKTIAWDRIAFSYNVFLKFLLEQACR